MGRLVTKIFYDTEFLEDGNTVELISIGMVADNGDMLYLVNAGMPLGRIYQHRWLMANVVPHLPLREVHFGLTWDDRHPDYTRVRPLPWIRDAVRQFVLGAGSPELWAYYGAYDHVALCQLFGPMVDLPGGFPMWTNDLQQLVARTGIALPRHGGDEHNAWDDAKWAYDAFKYVSERWDFTPRRREEMP